MILEKKMMEMENAEKKNDKKLGVYEEINEKRIVSLENIIKKLNNLIEEKDDRIVQLGKKIDDLEKRLTAKKDDEINKKLQNLETLINKQINDKLSSLETNIKDITKIIFKLTKCEFTSYSESVLKTHIKKIHDKLSKSKEATQMRFM